MGPLMLIKDTHMLHRIVVVQVFLAVALFTAFPVAALLEERKALRLSLEQSEARYRQLANADALTGLANRRSFDDRLEAEWKRALEARQSLALLLIDVDLFKSYNDLCGHMSGDECLREIASLIARGLPRSSDVATRFWGRGVCGDSAGYGWGAGDGDCREPSGGGGGDEPAACRESGGISDDQHRGGGGGAGAERVGAFAAECFGPCDVQGETSGTKPGGG